jgi:hypothetical protein
MRGIKRPSRFHSAQDRKKFRDLDFCNWTAPQPWENFFFQPVFDGIRVNL